MKNAFYFILQALFVLKAFKFLSWLVENNLIERLVSKFMTSQTGKQIITIHILANTLKSNGNQAMKFGDLIKYNVLNIFLQRSCRKWGKETSSTPLFVSWKSFTWG